MLQSNMRMRIVSECTHYVSSSQDVKILAYNSQRVTYIVSKSNLGMVSCSVQGDFRQNWSRSKCCQVQVLVTC